VNTPLVGLLREESLNTRASTLEPSDPHHSETESDLFGHSEQSLTISKGFKNECDLEIEHEVSQSNLCNVSNETKST